MYVLQNCEEVSPFLQKYMDNQALTSNETDYSDFLDWFQARVFELCAEKKATDELTSLAVGLDKVAKLYPMIMANGFRFHTRARALGKKTQNSGVLVKGDDLDIAKEYYGVLDHIYELSYRGNRKTSPRDLFNMPDEDVVGRDEQGEAYQQSRTELNVQTNDEIDDDITVTLHRVDIDPENIILTSNDVQRGKRGVQRGQRGVRKDSSDVEDNDTDVDDNNTDVDEDYIESSLMSRVSKARRRRGNHGLVHETNDEDEAMSSSQLPQIQQNNDETQSPSSKRNVRGRYRGKEVNKLTKNGEKIEIDLAKGMKRVVGAKAMMVANECGNVLRSTVSLRDCITWNQVTAKYGEVMMRKMKDMFKPREGRDEVIFHGYCVMAMQKALRTWKSNLHEEYKAYATDELRLENQPDSISPEDWRWLLEYFATPQFMAQSERNKINRSKLTTKHCCGPKSFAEVEEATHARTKQGVLVWSDPQSQEIHGRIQQLVNEQAEVPVEEPRMSRDEILASVLGERSGYVRGNGYGAMPSKRKLNQTEVDSRVSSAIETARAEIRAEREAEREEDRVQMRTEIRADMRAEREAEREEDRVQMRAEIRA
ncbi:uncharacterized protein G2W53_044597 [Senna tora]|uniref:Transposase n=1 Tax=Senna tora TaxID=362788 RepID=A0A834SNK6_9FABA|nr:uncharacterized protein G2W53_044597 [Senna tora]